MKVTYKPEDAPKDHQEWDFDSKRIRTSAAIRLSEAYGGSGWDEFEMGVLAGDPKARRVLLWHLMTIDHPTLKLKDVPDFYTGEVETEQSSKELLEQYERVFKLVPEGKREQFQHVFDVQLAEAREREGLPDATGTIDGEVVEDKSAKPGKELKPSANSATTTG